MARELERRKWLVRIVVAYLAWVLIMAGLIGFAEAGEFTALPLVSLLAAVGLLALYSLYIEKALTGIRIPIGRPAEQFGLLLYTFYLYLAVVLVVSGTPALTNIPALADYPGYSLAKAASIGGIILGLAWIISFALWHRAYLKVVRSRDTHRLP